MSQDVYGLASIAEICHEANRALCKINGDLSQNPWQEAEQWQKDSAVQGVIFCLANPDAPASANHESWSRQKYAEGWVYGPTKDPIAKTHPCLVPFEELPPQQQSKDHLFKAIVAGLLPFVENPAEAQVEATVLQLPAGEEAETSTEAATP